MMLCHRWTVCFVCNPGKIVQKKKKVEITKAFKEFLELETFSKSGSLNH